MRFFVYKHLLRSLSTASKSYSRFIHEIDGIKLSSFRRRPGFITNQGWKLLPIPVGSFFIGLYYEKMIDQHQEYLSELAHRSVEDPVKLPLDELDQLEDFEYCQTEVTGTFLHDKEMYLSDRKLKSGLDVFIDYPAKLNTYGYEEPQYHGYHVITPFKISNTDKIILVDRGWVDKEHLDPKTRPKGNLTQEINVTGIIRLSEDKKSFIDKLFAMKDKEEDNGSKIWSRRDIEAMAASVDKCLPILIEAWHDSYVPGGPVPGQTILDNQTSILYYHRMFQIWFCISLTTSVYWYFKFIDLPKLWRYKK